MGKWRVLVVDDDQDIRDLVRTSLEPGYEVVEARDGLDALEKLERAEPDFVVLDVMMPLMDGIQTCEAIRRHSRYRDMTVLFLSALASQADIRKGYDAGANLYLTKPFDPARLKRNIDLFFEKRAVQEPPLRKFTLRELEQLEKSGPGAISAAVGHAAGAGPAEPRQQAVAGSSPAAASAGAPQTPSANTSAGAASNAPPTARGAAMMPRVLVVDDEAGICSLAVHALHNEFEVFCASDGIDAVSKITLYQPDIIIIDTMMPRMSGYQLCQSLRQNARFAHTPIVLASAKHSQKDRDYSLRIGANAFLQKPYTEIELLHVTREMMKRPDFRVHVKALSAQAIHDLENLHGERNEEKQQERVRQEDVSQLQDFVRRHTLGG